MSDDNRCFRNHTKFATDVFVKRDMSTESLAKLRLAFDKDGIVTAGNASGITMARRMIRIVKNFSNI